MAAFFQLSILQVQAHLLKKSTFLGQTHISNIPLRPTQNSTPPSSFQSPVAKFNLFELLGGRGLCNGEEGLEKEIKKKISDWSPSTINKKEQEEPASVDGFPEDAFEKELLGFTGGFPGGEKGLQKFIDENPPPRLG